MDIIILEVLELVVEEVAHMQAAVVEVIVAVAVASIDTLNRIYRFGLAAVAEVPLIPELISKIR